MANLLQARGFRKTTDDGNIYEKIDESNNEKYNLTIKGHIFDDDDNLIYFKPEEWSDDMISLVSESLIDDLPF